MSPLKSPIHRTLWIPALVGLLLPGCSDPSPPSAQGSFTATFSGAGNCPPYAYPTPGPTIGVGTASDTRKTLVQDGTASAEVSCSVTPSGQGYAATVTIRQGDNYLDLNTDVEQGKETKSRTFSIRGSNTTGFIYTSTTVPCTIKTINVGPGKVWGTFRCDRIEANQSVCGLDGAFAAEDCTGSE
jgi:hypothetical protein